MWNRRRPGADRLCLSFGRNGISGRESRPARSRAPGSRELRIRRAAPHLSAARSGRRAAGCAALGGAELAERYGESHPRSRVVAELAPGEVDYWRQVKPVLESRCTVCHGC